MNITIATYNIGCTTELDKVVSFMENLRTAKQPVVCAIQEVEQNAVRTDYLDMPGIISGGKPHVFAKSISFDPTESVQAPINDQHFYAPWHYGHAQFASNISLKKSSVIKLGPDEQTYWKHAKRDWDNKNESEPRTGIIAKYMRGNNEFYVASIHAARTPDRSKPSQIRFNQLNLFMTAINDCVPTSAPLFVVGDFNATPDNLDLSVLKGELDVNFANKPTYYGKEKFTIDHIFYRNAKPKRHTRVGEEYCSDHRPVIAQFTL